MDKALLGFREWEVSNDLLYPLNAWALSDKATSQKMVDIDGSNMEWKRGINTAECMVQWPEMHKALGPCPHLDHHCGLNAYFDLEVIKEHSWNFKEKLPVRTTSDAEFFGSYLQKTVVGAIAGSGAIQIHQTGYRAEQAQVLALFVKETQAFDKFKRVADNYDIPIFTNEEKFVSFVCSKASYINKFQIDKTAEGYEDSWRNLIWPLDSVNDKPSLVLRDGKSWYKNNLLHRDHDLPALIKKNENRKEWYQHGLLHRDSGGPTVVSETDKIICKKRRHHGIPHRENDLPAYTSYCKETKTFRLQSWIQNDKYHRTNGPAMIYYDGTLVWYIHGKCIRSEGPRASNFHVISDN